MLTEKPYNLFVELFVKGYSIISMACFSRDKCYI